MKPCCACQHNTFGVIILILYIHILFLVVFVAVLKAIICAYSTWLSAPASQNRLNPKYSKVSS